MKDNSELIAFAQNWPDEVRERAMDSLDAILRGERRAFYCKSPGRACDGEPHKGYPYNHARGDQWPPPGTDWRRWFLSGGRGSGKTRTGSEFTLRMSEHVGRIALVAPTGADVRDTMVEGESGLMMVAAMAGKKLDYEPSKRRLTFPNGCVATTFSAEQPARLRGPQHGFAWLDEPAHMPLIEEVWSNLSFGLRLGTRPRVVLTSTPLPTKWVKKIQAHPKTRVVRVSTYANKSNLADDFLEEIREEYEGTRLGLQELYGQVLTDVIGALWKATLIGHEEAPDEFERVVVAIDPAGTANRRSDETGIIVVGKNGEHAWVLEDGTGKYSPKEWATKAHTLYTKWGADAIVVEKNYGGDMVVDVVSRYGPKMDIPPRILVKQATRSKQLRAEPVVGLYEQGRVFHRKGADLAELEDEMLTWVPGPNSPSPNRVDALVWGIMELMKGGGEGRIASARGMVPPGSAPSRAIRRLLGPNFIDFSTIRRSA